MKKPIYKQWWFWVVLILVIGWIGSLGNDKKTADQAPAATIEPVKEVLAIATVEPTIEPTEAPTVAPTVVPTETPKPTLAPTVAPTKAPATSQNWESEIVAIAASDGSKTEKADAAESLARKYTPESNDELLKYFIHLATEFTNDNYLAQIDNDKYMLTNIFESVLVEKHAQNKYLKNFAQDFYQNTKYTYRGADTVDSESVISNEEQMIEALSQIKTK